MMDGHYDVIDNICFIFLFCVVRKNHSFGKPVLRFATAFMYVRCISFSDIGVERFEMRNTHTPGKIIIEFCSGKIAFACYVMMAI